MDTRAISSELRSTTEILEDIVSDIVQQNRETMERLNLTEPFCNRVAEMSDEDIDAISFAQIEDLFKEFGGDDSRILADFAERSPNVSAIDKWKSLLKEIRDAFADSKSYQNTRSEMAQALADIKKEQGEFLRSQEYIDAYNEKVERLRHLAETEPEDTKRKKYLETLTAIRRSNDLTFIFDRFEENPTKETERVLSIFFNNQKGEYALKRYHDHIKRLGYAENFHVALFNMEETILPEEYHPYNNFFLYYIMLLIAYLDVNNERDKTYAASLLVTLNSLVSGSIDAERREMVVAILKRFYSYIITDERTAYFKENNKLWKEHPYRIEIETQRQKKSEEAGLRDDILWLTAKCPGAARLADGTWINPGMLDKLGYDELKALKASTENRAAVLKSEEHLGADIHDDERGEETGDPASEEQ